MGNYYRSGYQLSRRREKWIDIVSMVLIVVAMIGGLAIGFGVGYVGRVALTNQVKEQQVVIKDLHRELETKAFFGHPRQMKMRGGL